MELTAIERLTIFLELNHPKAKMHNVFIDSTPGYMKNVYFKRGLKTVELIDIRGAGYPKRIDYKAVSSLRLWRELHEIYSHKVDVIRVVNAQATKIEWGGRTYHLDRPSTYKKPKKGK